MDRKRKAENNYPPTLAPARRQQDNFQRKNNKEMEEIIKGRRRPILNFEAQESFEWPKNTYYMGFLIDFQQRNKDLVARLDDAIIDGQLVTSDFLDFVINRDEGEYFIQKLKDIVKLSYAVDLIHHATENPEVVYKVLKTVALMSVDAADNLTLTLRDCYYLFDAADTTALWADILRTHGAFVVSKIKAHQMAQEAYTQELLAQAQTQDFTFQLPSEIIMSSGAFFVFLKHGERMHRPEVNNVNYDYYVGLFVLKIMEQVLKIKQPTVSVLVIYKILKTVTSMNVHINAQTGRKTLQFVANAGIKSGLEVLLKPPVKAELITLLMQKKSNHLSRMASLVTKRFGPEGGPAESIEMLFLCADEKCAPVRRTDQLLSFLKEKKYVSDNFLKIVFKTLEVINPQACFLSSISLTFSINGKDETVAVVSNIEDFDVEKYRAEQIDACGGSLTLMAIPFTFNIKGQRGEGHANMFIVDPNKRECEHFEPHGEYFLDKTHTALNREIEDVATRLCDRLFPSYTYIARSEATNFQSMLNRKFKDTTHGGTCLVWSIWYAYLRLSHPEFPREVILRRSYDLLAHNDFAELERFIIKFMAQLNAIAGIYRVQDKFFNSNGQSYH